MDNKNKDNHTTYYTNHATDTFIKLRCFPARVVRCVIGRPLVHKIFLPYVMVQVVSRRYGPDNLVVLWVYPQDGTAAGGVHPLMKVACNIQVVSLTHTIKSKIVGMLLLHGRNVP